MRSSCISLRSPLLPILAMAAAGAAAGSGEDGIEEMTAAMRTMGMTTQGFTQWKSDVENNIMENSSNNEAIKIEVTKVKGMIKGIEDVGNGMQKNIEDAMVRVHTELEKNKMASEECKRAVRTVDQKVEYLGKVKMTMIEELKEKISKHDILNENFTTLSQKLDEKWKGLEEWATQIESKGMTG